MQELLSVRKKNCAMTCPKWHILEQGRAQKGLWWVPFRPYTYIYWPDDPISHYLLTTVKWTIARGPILLFLFKQQL